MKCGKVSPNVIYPRNAFQPPYKKAVFKLLSVSFDRIHSDYGSCCGFFTISA
jgi:hypothetical protein